MPVSSRTFPRPVLETLLPCLVWSVPLVIPSQMAVLGETVSKALLCLLQTQHSDFLYRLVFPSCCFCHLHGRTHCTEHIAMHTYKKLKAASSDHQRTELHRQWVCHTVCTVHAANRFCACCKHTVCRLQTHSGCCRHTVPAANILCMLQTYCACCRHTLTAAGTLRLLQTYCACCKQSVHVADTL